MQVEITYHRIPLTLVGTYSPVEKQTQNYPGCSASFDIEAILVGGVNIDGIVDPDEIDYMAAMACDQIARDKRESDEDAAVEAVAAPSLYEYHLTVDGVTVVYHQASNAYELMRKGVIAGKRVTLFRQRKTVATCNAHQGVAHE